MLSVLTGDASYGMDPHDPARVAQDASEAQCVHGLPAGPARAACLAKILGSVRVVPDPADLAPPGRQRTMTVRGAPPEAAGGPEGGGGGGGGGAAPPPPSLEDDASARFLSVSSPLLMLEASSGAAAGAAAGASAEAALPPPASAIILLSEMRICVNEVSRSLIRAMFRGIVGANGEIECVDVPR